MANANIPTVTTGTLTAARTAMRECAAEVTFTSGNHDAQYANALTHYIDALGSLLTVIDDHLQLISHHHADIDSLRNERDIVSGRRDHAVTERQRISA